MASLAEDLFLLLLDRDTGALAGRSHHRIVLGGALLSELALDGSAVLEEKTGLLHRPKVRVAGTPPAAPLLASAYAAVAARPRTPQDLVKRLGKGVMERLAADLVARGVLREERGRAYGVLPQTRWPAAGAYRDERSGSGSRPRWSSASRRTRAPARWWRCSRGGARAQGHRHPARACPRRAQAGQGARRGRLGREGREGRDRGRQLLGRWVGSEP